MYCESVPPPTAPTMALNAGMQRHAQKQNVIDVVMWSENGKRGKKNRLASDKNGQNRAAGMNFHSGLTLPFKNRYDNRQKKTPYKTAFLR